MNTISEDEIDLRELFGMIWRGKLLIIFCVVAAIALALKTIPSQRNRLLDPPGAILQDTYVWILSPLIFKGTNYTFHGCELN